MEGGTLSRQAEITQNLNIVEATTQVGRSTQHRFPEDNDMNMYAFHEYLWVLWIYMRFIFYKYVGMRFMNSYVCVFWIFLFIY